MEDDLSLTERAPSRDREQLPHVFVGHSLEDLHRTGRA